MNAPRKSAAARSGARGADDTGKDCTDKPTAANDSVQREPPEHRGERRRFIAWAVLAGFARPESMTAAVLAEIEFEAAR